MSFQVEVLDRQNKAFPNTVKTLLLDDSTFDRARIRRMSHRTALVVDLTEVGTIAAFKEAVARETFDLILIDYRLPQGDGLEVLTHLQSNALNEGVATIMITGNGDMETAVTAMRNGCHDFLSKEAMTADHLRVAMVTAMQTAAAQRDLVAQSAHQREVIRQGLTAALMDRKVQGAFAELFKEQFQKCMVSSSSVFTRHDDSDLEALIVTLQEDDDFIFS